MSAYGAYNTLRSAASLIGNARQLYSGAKTVNKALGYDSNWNNPAKYKSASGTAGAPSAGKMRRIPRPRIRAGTILRKRYRKTRGRVNQVRKSISQSIARARKGAVREVFNVLAPRNEFLDQVAGQIRTAGVGITGQGNQNLTQFSPVFTPSDISTLVNVITTSQGIAGAAGSVSYNGALYDNILLDNIGGKRSHHKIEFVNPGNQDVHFTVWWLKAKQDMWECSAYTTILGFLAWAVNTSTSINRGGVQYTGTYTSVTNPYNIIGWNPNQVRNHAIRHFFRVKVGKTSVIRPGGHHNLRVPLGKGARSLNVADYQIANFTAAQGKLLCRKGDIIPIVVTYGDVVHGSNASGNTTTVSTGSVTLDWIRQGCHYWQARPIAVPQQHFPGVGFNQTTALGGGVTLADASGAPAVYSADA